MCKCVFNFLFFKQFLVCWALVYVRHSVLTLLKFHVRQEKNFTPNNRPFLSMWNFFLSYSSLCKIKLQLCVLKFLSNNKPHFSNFELKILNRVRFAWDTLHFHFFLNRLKKIAMVCKALWSNLHFFWYLVDIRKTTSSHNDVEHFCYLQTFKSYLKHWIQKSFQFLKKGLHKLIVSAS